MGLLGKLKDAVGIGSMKVDIQFANPGINPGDPIAGNAILHGAASDTRITSVLLQLVNFGVDVQTVDIISEDYWGGSDWETYERKFKHATTLFETFLAQDFTLAKGQRLEIPFDISTPPDLLPSDRFNRYVVKVVVDIPGMIDAKAARPLKVLVGAGMAMGGAARSGAPVEDAGDMPSPGERVLAFYEDAHYESTVLAVLPEGIHIQWDDGADSVVPFDAVLPSESAVPTPADLGVGQRVMARYGDGFYECSIDAVQGAQVGIQWDDGSQTWVGLHDVRLL
jgi:hypothetical protein